jgi:plasmid stabilization system protein ParE
VKATFEDPIPYAACKYIEELEAEVERLRAALKLAVKMRPELRELSEVRQALEDCAKRKVRHVRNY